MTEYRGMKTVDGVETRPLVSLVMNFTKPTEATPSLLTFDEVETFLHEFGHSLHGMLAEGSTARRPEPRSATTSWSSPRRSWRTGRPRRSISISGPCITRPGRRCLPN